LKKLLAIREIHEDETIDELFSIDETKER